MQCQHGTHETTNSLKEYVVFININLSTGNFCLLYTGMPMMSALIATNGNLVAELNIYVFLTETFDSGI